MRTLDHGTKGADVTSWQTFLIGQGLLEAGGADGVSGPKTEQATKQYQAKHGLEADGIVGPNTTAAAQAEGFAPPAAPAAQSFSSSQAGPLGEIHPVLAQRVAQLLEQTAQQHNIESMVHDGFRSFDEQTALFNQGRTTPGTIVTKARAGESYHNYGLAVDIVTNQQGRPAWIDRDERLRGPIGQNLSLEWGGAWTSFVDLPHFQLTGGLSVRQCLDIYTQHGNSIQAVWEEVTRRLNPAVLGDVEVIPGEEVE